ncbi:lipocalin family protein [Defluviimonas sp. WL0002]|uniref:Lipocalin family protein n=1 Tax=Albidovulum marisflavi TaxID=2984159 RepID=A0ABT2ZCJ8_9RHOB|nr:lipocalin family protein [Defluviimonas sp. WL0002]MCV2868802.1 lipocalin family protein [Defluviimonas sp. WL0002]
MRRSSGRLTGVALAALIALAGCGGAPSSAVRDPSVTIASLALFDPARMSGTWHLAAAFGNEAACGALTESWTPRGDGSLAVRGEGCARSGRVTLDTVAMPSGPGRFVRRGASGEEALWVLWVDAGDRVAVIGTPDGSFGRILSREPAPRSDLLQAARDVLAFNGYDVARLAQVNP